MRKLLFLILTVLSLASCTQQWVLPPWYFDNIDSDESEITTPYDVASEEEFDRMISEKGEARLTQDISIDWLNLTQGGVKIDLNGNTLKIRGMILQERWFYGLTVQQGATLYIENGIIVFDEPFSEALKENTTIIDIYDDSSVVFDKVEFSSSACGIGLLSDGSSFTATDSFIKANGIAIGTNASTAPDGLRISLTRTDVIAEGCAVNLTMSGTYTFQDSNISAGHVGMLARGGNVNITGGSIHSDASSPVESNEDYYFAEYCDDWGDGDSVAYAALTIGNYGDGYNFTTDVTVSNCDITVSDSDVAPEAARIYIASDGERVELDIDNTAYANEIKSEGWYCGDNTHLTTPEGTEQLITQS